MSVEGTPVVGQPYAVAGGLIVTEYGQRHMKAYLVHDNELKTISMLNGWATLFFSLASFCGSAWLGLWANLFVAETPSAIATRYGEIMQRIFGGASAVCLVLAVLAVASRRSQISTIKREAGENTTPTWRRIFAAKGKSSGVS